MADPERLRKIYEMLDSRAPGQDCPFEVDDLMWLCDQTKEVLKSESTLLSVSIPDGSELDIIGDIHGQFDDMMAGVFQNVQRQKPVSFLFLGDYVDRGANSLETITLLFVMKCNIPDSFHLLRGNHETRDISREYGFLDECRDRYGTDAGEQIWNAFNDVFDWLPLAAIVQGIIFCVHGGISQHLTSWDDIENLERPIKSDLESDLVTDMLWADPSPDNGWRPSERGSGNTFGLPEAQTFLQAFNLLLVCRAHQVVSEGSEFPFAPDRSVVTVFSAPNYCGEINNQSAMMVVDYDSEREDNPIDVVFRYFSAVEQG